MSNEIQIPTLAELTKSPFSMCPEEAREFAEYVKQRWTRDLEHLVRAGHEVEVFAEVGHEVLPTRTWKGNLPVPDDAPTYPGDWYTPNVWIDLPLNSTPQLAQRVKAAMSPLSSLYDGFYASAGEQQ